MWTDPSGSSCYEATVLTVAAVCHLLLTTCSRSQTDHHSWDSAEHHTQLASQTAQVCGSANSSSDGGPH